MADFVQTLITALTVGSLYALIALGYTMVYGILKFINFAHSDIVVLGAWLSYVIATSLLPAIGINLQQGVAPPLWIGASILLAAMVACGAIGFTIERLAYRPLRKAPRLNVLITAIGVSLLLQNVGQLNYVFGPSPQRMPSLLPEVGLLKMSWGANQFASEWNWPPLPNADLLHLSLPIGNISRDVVITLVDAVIIGTAALLMVVLEYLVFRTKLGTAMRAVSFDFDAAALMGIPVDRVVSFTFVLGSALAAAAGFLYALKYPGLNQPAHATWVLLGLKAFVAAVVGGIGNVRGAVLGGFVIAFVESYGVYYIGPNYRDVYVFALLIVILLIRPSGLLGSTVREKV